jgi:hypothetical protein
MMFTHVLINQLRGDKSRKRTAREELWKAQGYDAFSTAQSGGICRNTIRNAAYKALLGAESITREKGVFIPSLMTFDFDLDGDEEYLFQDEHINCYVTARGAGVFEFDFLPKTWNYLDTLEDRTPEGAPRSRRTAFADTLAPAGFSLTDYRSGAFTGCRRCSAEWYEPVELDRVHEKARFRLNAEPERVFGSIGIEKTFQLNKDSLIVHYEFTNRGDRREEGTFITEINLSLPGEGRLFQRIFSRQGDGKEPVSFESGELVNTAGIELQDLKNEVIINVTSDRNFDAWLVPLRTQCRIYGKDTGVYQSTCIVPVKKISLAPGERWETGFTLKLVH